MRRLIVCAAALLAACVPPQKDYTKLVAADPHAILVVPVVNKSIDVDAADYFLSTLPVPLAERGYYVFPVNLVKRVLEDDGLGDASLVHGADPTRLCALFGADAVLYATIEQWTAAYMVFTTQVTVEASYTLKDGKTGETLWVGTQKMVYSPQSSSGNPIADLVANAITAAVVKAKPNYLPLARKANAAALQYPGPGLPAGPYGGEYKRDLAFGQRGIVPATDAPRL